jgi:hypothetical protein
MPSDEHAPTQSASATDGEGSTPAARFFAGRGASLLLVLLALALYAPTMDNGFFNIDDRTFIVNNPHLQDVGADTIVQLLDPRSVVSTQRDYPLVLMLTFALQQLVSPNHAPAFHIVNVLLYALVCALLLALLRRHLRGSAAFAVAALFAAHPLHAESVAWIVGRADLLAHAFVFGALLSAFVPERPTRVGYAIGVLLWVPASLSRLLPGVVLVLFAYDVLVRQRSWRHAALRVTPFALITGTTVVAKIFLVAQRLDAVDVALWQRPLYALLLLQRYLTASVAPVQLSFYYPPYPPLGSLLLELVTSVLLLVLIGAWAVVRMRGRPPKERRVALFCAALFVLALSPFLSLVPFNFMQADRYAFLAVLGVLLAVVLGARRALDARGYFIVVAVLGVMFAGVSVSRVQVWESNSSIWHDALVKSGDPFARLHYGMALLEEGQPERAAPHLVQVIDERPNGARAYPLAAEALIALGQHARAERLLARGEQLTQDAAVRLALADLLVMRRARSEAVLVLCRIPPTERASAAKARQRIEQLGGTCD